MCRIARPILRLAKNVTPIPKRTKPCASGKMPHPSLFFTPLEFHQICHPSSRYAPVTPGLMDVIHRKCNGPRATLRELATAAGWRDASQSFCALARCLLSPTRATSTSPRPPSPPYPTSRSHAMIRIRRKPQNGKHQKCVPSTTDGSFRAVWCILCLLACPPVLIPYVPYEIRLSAVT